MGKIFVFQDKFSVDSIEANFEKIKNAYLEASTQAADFFILPQNAIDGFGAKKTCNNSLEASCKIKGFVQNIAQVSTSTAIIFDSELYSGKNELFFIRDKKICRSEGEFLLVNGAGEASAAEGSETAAACGEGNGLATTTSGETGGGSILICRSKDFCPSFIEKHKPQTLICIDAQHYYGGDDFGVRLLKMGLEKKVCNLVYANMFGGIGNFVMCGGSFVSSIFGSELEYFENLGKTEVERRYKALKTCIRDYCASINAKKACLGLSGGIDSAVVLPIAADALGKENVIALLMPSQFSSEHSVSDAKALAEKLGVEYHIIEIEDIYKVYIQKLEPIFKDLPFSLAEENLQARIRGVLLMATSNKLGAILLNTSNKSEAACGYGTLYGDMCGGLSVLGDLYKREVYELANYVNRNEEIIPQNSILKPPSAELRPNQKDSDSLPSYDDIEKILRLYIEEGLRQEEIIARGLEKEVVDKLLRLFKINDFKRKQAPMPIICSRFPL